MFAFFIFFLTVIRLCVSTSHCGEQQTQYRSTEEWKTLFIGKCLLYKLEYGQKLLCNDDIDCSYLWRTVEEAVAFERQCNFALNAYDEFIRASQHFVPRDKFIFWSGVYSLVMRYSNKGRNVYTISDTLTGFLFDNIVWCGNISEPDGIEKYSHTCPGYSLNDDCPNTAQYEFWKSTSKNFAKRAYGDIYVMMNATRSPAFRDRSFFTQYELPNLNPMKVTKATILMVHYLNQPANEQACIKLSDWNN